MTYGIASQLHRDQDRWARWLNQVRVIGRIWRRIDTVENVLRQVAYGGADRFAVTYGASDEAGHRLVEAARAVIGGTFEEPAGPSSCNGSCAL